MRYFYICQTEAEKKALIVIAKANDILVEDTYIDVPLGDFPIFGYDTKRYVVGYNHFRGEGKREILSMNQMINMLMAPVSNNKHTFYLGSKDGVRIDWTEGEEMMTINDYLVETKMFLDIAKIIKRKL